MAISKHGRGFELGTIENKSRQKLGWDLNLAPLDYKSSVLMARPPCLHKEEIDTFDCSVNVLTVYVATHLSSHLSLKTTAEPPHMDVSHRQTPYLNVHILIVVPVMYKIKLCNTYSI